MNDSSSSSSKKSRKFFFDMNKFDAEEEETAPVEDLPPPPPTFGEEELMKARRDAYAEGHKAGLKEAHQSIEQQVSTALNTIRDHFELLFRTEAQRYATFEAEAVQLAHALFTQAFPSLNRHTGLDEIRAMITDVLINVREVPEIIIEVPDIYVDAISRHVDSVIRDLGQNANCIVRGHAGLGVGQCRMNWKNGTAVRDPHHLAEKINLQIQQILADRANLTDNGKDMNASAGVSVTTDSGPAPADGDDNG